MRWFNRGLVLGVIVLAFLNTPALAHDLDAGASYGVGGSGSHAFFPCTLNEKWVYSSNYYDTATRVVTSVKADTVTVRESHYGRPDNKRDRSEVFSVTSESVTLMGTVWSGTGDPYAEYPNGCPIIPENRSPGYRQTTTGDLFYNGRHAGTYSAVTKVIGMVNVTVGGRSLRALKTKMTLAENFCTGTNRRVFTYWFVKGVGIVKQYVDYGTSLYTYDLIRHIQ